jgi:hypothetical protein
MTFSRSTRDANAHGEKAVEKEGGHEKDTEEKDTKEKNSEEKDIQDEGNSQIR